MAEEFLDPGDLAARVEELRGASVAQPMGVHRYIGPLSDALQPPMDEVFGDSLVAIEKNMVT